MKYNWLYRIFCVIFLMCAASAYSLDLPKRTIGANEFYCYKVEANETIYGISRKLNISKEDLMKYNPSLVNGLKKGHLLLIPVEILDIDTAIKNSSTVAEVTANVVHVVERGETLYGLSKTYNVSQDDLISLNPSITGGLKAGQKVLIPQPKSQSINDKGENVIYHTIQKGETLYSLSKKYETTIESILTLNPGISPTNFKINEIIKIVPNSVRTEVKETTTTEMVPYIVQKGDDLKKIAKKNDVDESDLKAANPNAKKVVEGLTIQLPVQRTDVVEVPINEGNADELRNNNSLRIKEIYDSIHELNTDDEVNIALLLPFMLNDTVQSKQSKLYTEFYKGFLLAVNEFKNNINSNLNIHAFDTQSGVNNLDKILSKPELKEMDLIFAPTETEQLESISKFCNDNKIYMVNAFSLKTEDYNTNPYIYQINIPQTFMYADVFNWFDETFANHEIVFVHKKGSKPKDFANELKSYIEATGKSVRQIEYGSALLSDMLSEKADSLKQYLFVPTSANMSVMSQIVSATKRLKIDKSQLQTSILGYPEWVTYMDEWTENYQVADTYIYTRFFVKPEDPGIAKFNNEYQKWYGEKLINAAPTFGYLGYDTGRYFISLLTQNNNSEYEGLQNHFNFERISNWSGYINKSVYIVHFTPLHNIEIEVK